MDESVRRVAEHYSAQAEEFARYWAPLLRSMSREMLTALPLGDARVVLDVGVGTGGLVAELRGAAPRATILGVDPAEGMLRVAQRDTGIPLAMSTATAIGLASGCVDVAVMSFVLHRLSDPVEALAEIARVLRAGGAVGTASWGRPARSAAAAVWEDELAALGLPRESPGVSEHGNADTPDKVRALFAAAGLRPGRAWARTFEERRDLEGWLAFQLGASGRSRLDRVPSAARERFVARVRERAARLPADAFVFRPEAVFGVATASG